MAEINTDAVYKKLKKQNGEAFAHVIRDAVLLDVPNILHILEFAGRNPDEARQLVPVIREVYKTKQDSGFEINKKPLELLNDAGYDAFVVKTLGQQNSIKKYYRSGEELCTFSDPERYKNYYMIHAVKRGTEKIKPAKNPERQDEYGTSVISIQIAKTGGFISIKNRYNHTVNNPDNTFDSNPDKIIPGLADSLKKYFHVEFNTTRAPLPGNFHVVNDQLVRYNHEINNVYFGPDYYFSGSTITRLNNDNQILINPDILLTILRGNNSVVSVAGANKDLSAELNEYMRDKKVSVSVGEDKTKSILVNGERFIDVKNGTLTYIYVPHMKKLKLKNWAAFVGDLDFSGIESLDLDGCLGNVTDVKLNPKAKEILLHGGKLSGKVDLSGVDRLDLKNVNMTDVTDIKLNPKAKEISLRGGKLSGNVDLSGVERLDLDQVDMTDVTDIKLNPKAKEISLCGGKLSGNVDLSGVSALQIINVNLDDVNNVKFNSNAVSIGLHRVKLSGQLDFSNVEEVDLSYADLTGVDTLKLNPHASEEVDLSHAQLAGNVDFSGIRNVKLFGADLTKVQSIKFDSEGKKMPLRGVKLGGDWDFSNIEDLDLEYADLTAVNSIKLPQCKQMSLRGVKLGGDWDFSDVEKLNLEYADLTAVNSIKFNPNAYFGGIFVDEKWWHYPTSVNLLNADLRNTNINFNINNGYVSLRGATLSGDLDFSDVEKLDLVTTNLSEVKSIKVSPRIYKEIKDVKINLNDVGTVRIRDLPKYGVVIKKPNVFVNGKKKLLEKMQRLVQSVSHNANDK